MIAISSGEQAASAVICGVGAKLTAIHLIGDGSNDPKVILHDNATAASGTVKAEVADDVSVSGEATKHVMYPHPVDFVNGIYATISGSNASYIIEFVPEGN